MSLASVIVHKGRREEKYKIYVEDYVLSFLKKETGTLEVTEFVFYGYRENNNKKYLIYGAGRGRHLAVFDKYSLLDEIGCRLTQAGPVFFVREDNNAIYEVKGYDIFYQNNTEMQNYLIERHRESDNSRPAHDGPPHDGPPHDTSAYDKRSYDGLASEQTKHKGTPHTMVTIQLCVILVVLVAIVINSTNSYDKMVQLSRSAEEVFFAMENQEAQNADLEDGVQGDITVTRTDTQEDDTLKLVSLENQAPDITEQEIADAEEGDGTRDSEAAAEMSLGEGTAADDAAESGTEKGETADSQTEAESEYDEVEALSRNVARYYEIEKGDTLYTISREIYGDIDHVSDICELNNISNPDHIRYGQKIILP